MAERLVDEPSPAARARALVGQMNATEMMVLLNGIWGLGWGPPTHPYVGNVPAIPRLGIPWLSLQDGPQGYRDGRYGHYANSPGTATQWPSGLAIAATWDPSLAGEWGTAMGTEFRRKGANVQLGPGLNVARVPWGGRNFEYLSGEDPRLGATMVRPVVEAIQRQGVIATAKHFLLNNQEDHRGNMSSNVDERTLVELYLPPFEAAVEAGVGAVMCGYNRINGRWACEDPTTLGLLKGALGFQGWVMSDWGATHSTVASVRAGLDQEMPGGQYYTREQLQAALADGAIGIEAVSTMARRVVTSMYGARLIDDGAHGPTPRPPRGAPGANVTSIEHHALAARLASAGAVLLQNRRGVLPLSASASIAIVGPAANCEAPVPSFGFAWPPTAGCLNSGGGSGSVVAAHVDSIVAAIARTAREVRYSNGSDVRSASTMAAAADAAVVVVGTTSCEGTDRPHTGLPSEQLRYLHAVAASQPRTIVLLMAPGAVNVGGWASAVAAVACFFLPGQAQGAAVASLLYGSTTFSGRLPVTMPARENEMGLRPSQYPGTPHADGLQTNYSEGLLVGYRWYHTHGVSPGFCFGHGLSYTTWQYGPLHATPSLASFTLTNTGSRAGAEVAQLYITFPDAAAEPPRQLRAFEKLTLRPGESTRVSLRLVQRDFAVWDAQQHSWTGVIGVYELGVGASSCDIRATTKLVISDAQS